MLPDAEGVRLSREGWDAYLKERFADASVFRVKSATESLSITDATGLTRTEIEIHLFEGGSELFGVYCFNPETPGWNHAQVREMGYCDLPDEERFFGEQAVSALESSLDMPLHQGWVESMYFHNGEHVKSVIQYGIAPNAFRSTVYLRRSGCLALTFDALRYSDWWLGSRLESRTVVAAPMVGSGADRRL